MTYWRRVKNAFCVESLDSGRLLWPSCHFQLSVSPNHSSNLFITVCPRSTNSLVPIFFLDHLSSLAPKTRIVISMSKINAVQHQGNRALSWMKKVCVNQYYWAWLKSVLSSTQNRFLSVILVALFNLAIKAQTQSSTNRATITNLQWHRMGMWCTDCWCFCKILYVA